MVPGEPLSSSWLAKHHRTSHFANVQSQPNTAGKREGETDRMRKPCASRQLEACFVRLSGRIGSAALCAPVAQRIERRFPKPCVGGSNPLGSANLKPLENIDISVISAVFVLLVISICCKIISLKGRLRAFGGDICGICLMSY